MDRPPLSEIVGRAADEWQERIARGERPDVEEYARRHPEAATVLRQILPALLVLADTRTGLRGGAAAADVPGRLGEYRIVREIGRGGMGVVYEAVQESLGRRVALKVLPVREDTSPVLRARFLREARAAARLHHSSVVPVFGVGEHDGTPYFAMQYIDGRPLHLTSFDRSDFADHARRVARIGLQAAEGLAHAHEQGVLHRDVKPSNLLLDARDGVWLTDFGLARADGLDDLTETGDVLGTLRYMPPERFGGGGDARSDVYSLGVTLHELLTGRPAFDAPDRPRLMSQVAGQDVPPVSRGEPRVPRDLETVVLKATAREPSRRYTTAQAMADDLRRFLEDRPVLARRVTWVGRAWRWARRNPAVAGLLAGVAAAVLAGLAGVAWQWRRAEANYRTAEDQRRRAEAGYGWAQEAVEELLTQAAEGLAELPQSDPYRRRLLVRAAELHRKFLDEHGDDPASRLEAARAYRRLAEIHALLGERSEAARELAAARAVLAGVDAAAPGCQAETARVALQEGRVAYDAADYAAADRHYQESLNALASARAARPDDDDLTSQEAVAWNHRGNALVRAGRPDDARSAYGQALTCLDGLDPSPATRRHQRATALGNLGSLDRDTRRPEEADRAYAESLDLLAGLVREASHRRTFRSQLAGTYVNQAGLWAAADPRRLPEALDAFTRAQDLQRRLAAEFPDVPAYRRQLAETSFNLGLVYQQLGSQSGVSRHRAAVGGSLAAASAGPFAALSGLVARADLYESAVEAYRTAARMQEGLLAEPGHASRDRYLLARTSGSLANALNAVGRFDESADVLGRAEALAQGLIEEFPGNADYESVRAVAASSQAARLRMSGRAPASLAQSRLALDWHRAAWKRAPSNQVLKGMLQGEYALLAETLIRSNDHAATTGVAEELLAEFPDESPVRLAAARLYARCLALAAPADAERYADRAAVLLRAWAGEDARRRAALRSQFTDERLRKRLSDL